MARPHDETQEIQTWKTCRNSRQEHTEKVMTTIDLMTQMSWVRPTHARKTKLWDSQKKVRTASMRIYKQQGC